MPVAHDLSRCKGMETERQYVYRPRHDAKRHFHVESKLPTSLVECRSQNELWGGCIKYRLSHHAKPFATFWGSV